MKFQKSAIRDFRKARRQKEHEIAAKDKFYIRPSSV